MPARAAALPLLGILLGVSAGEAPGPPAPWDPKGLSDKDHVVVLPGGKGITLPPDLTRLVPAFDPTDDPQITAMRPFGDRLLLAACVLPHGKDGGDLFTYAPAEGPCRKVFSVDEQGIESIEVHGGKAWVPGADATESWEKGNVYVYDGAAWAKKRTLPEAVHVFALAFDDEAVYAATGNKDLSGKVWRSADGGDTWTEHLSVPGPAEGYFVRCVALARSGKRLYAGIQVHVDTAASPPPKAPGGRPPGNLYTWDGKAWSSLRLDFGGDDLRALWAMSGTLVAQGGNQYYRLQKDAWAPLPQSWRKAFLLDTCTDGGKTWAVLQDLGASGVKLAEVDPSFAIKPLMDLPPSAQRLAWFAGRFWVGCKDGGQVLTCPAGVRKGSCTGPPLPLVPTETGVLSWTGDFPKGTGVQVQWRTAATPGELPKSTFRGPGGEAGKAHEKPGGSLAVPPGHAWIQFRAVLTAGKDVPAPTLGAIRVEPSVPEGREPAGK